MNPLVLLPLAVPPARILLHAYRRRRFPRDHAQSLIVLGTAQYDGVPSRQFAARLDHAVDLWRQGKVEHLYTVGGKLPGDRFTEAGVGSAYLGERGVDKQRITAVEEGNDTRGSYAELLRRHPELGVTLVVTDPNHALRAEQLARQAGMDAYASPTPTCPVRFPRKAWWNTLLHEVGGLVVVDVSRLLGRGSADKVETMLRRLQGWMRPSRRARHEQLEKEH